MSDQSIKDHWNYARMLAVPPAEAASWLLGEQPVEKVDKARRKEVFHRVAKNIMAGRAERAKYSFGSDTNGEIQRAMEWAFQAGLEAAAGGGPENKTK